MLRQTLVATLLFYIAGCAHTTTLNTSKVLSTKAPPESWQSVKAKEESYRLACFAVRDIPKDSVLKVLSAQSQPVIGTIYLLTFQMKSGKQWLAELYKDKKGNVTLLEILPLNTEKKKAKSQKNKPKRSRL